MSALEGLQAALAAEHAALYLYGVYGGRTSQAAEPGLYDALLRGYRDHRSRRDRLRLEVSDLGADPVPAAVAYRLPARLETPRSISRAALTTERACAQTYAALVASTVGRQRRWAVTALGEVALQQLRVGGRPEAFPGAPELG